jgi:dihydrofolate reductase
MMSERRLRAPVQPEPEGAPLKIIHYVTLTADGHVAQAERTGGIPPVIAADLMGVVAAGGGLVIGRRTFAIFQAMGAIASIPGAVVVVSQSLPAREPGVEVARSPLEALERLQDRGIAAAVIGGGAEIYSAFLALDRLDELYVNILPLIDGDGLSISTPARRELRLRLLSSRDLGGDTIQRRYARQA